eukprot:TRINITY_DN15187_c0_g1_i4.p1 TRINITY_DN15187_c0_g1~~TRINITY_DN15187_c0_g1_i4.p1  ORF type:complete len:1277 (+),score=95.69 TRINITY_DN15187_c0_g1_i4:1051-4881(+)
MTLDKVRQGELDLLHIANINTGGAPGMWRLFELLYAEEEEEDEEKNEFDVQDWMEIGDDKEVHSSWQDMSRCEERWQVIFVQETRAEETERLALEKSLNRKGYLCFWQQGTDSTGRWGEDKKNGGVALWIHKRCKVRCLALGKRGQCQYLLVEINGVLCLNTYAAPSAENRDTLAEVVMEVMEAHRGMFTEKPWLWLGDFNEEAEKSSFAGIAERFGGGLVSAEGPSRWDSTRKIDYGFSNQAKKATDVRYSEDKVSDHKILMMQIPVRCRLLRALNATRATPDWATPVGLTRKEWRKRLDEEFQQVRYSGIGKEAWKALNAQDIDVEREWKLLMLTLHMMFKKAASRLREELRGRHLAQTAGSEEEAKLGEQIKNLDGRLDNNFWKGQKMQMVEKPLQANGTICVETFRVRKLRNWIGRAQAWLAHAKGGKRLEEKWTKRVWAELEKPSSQEQAVEVLMEKVDEARAKLKKMEEAQKNLKVQHWKTQMKEGVKEVAGWIRRRRALAGVPFVECKGQVAVDVKQSCGLIARHWEQFWSSKKEVFQKNQKEEAISLMIQDIGQRRSEDWEWKLPEAEDMIKIARKARGAASTDGWTGDEISVIPDDALGWFWIAASRWHKGGKVPKVMSEVRQVSVPKPGKVKTGRGTIDAAAVRPISIMSAWWRLWMSAWVVSQSVKAWRQDVIPDEILGNKGSLGSEAGAAWLFQEIAKKGYGGSLDYSACYDSMDPEISVEVMREIGFPNWVLEPMREVWGSASRYICYGGNVEQQAVAAGDATPQGDPWGPLLMAIWMCAGLKNVRKKRSEGTEAVEKNVSEVIYMDDRSWAASSAEDCCREVTLWRKWSKVVGLCESEDKTQLVASSAVKKNQLVNKATKIGMEKKVGAELVALGAVSAFTARALNKKEEERLNGAARVLDVLKCVPCSRAAKVRYTQLFGTSKARYGWVARQPRVSDSKAFQVRAWEGIERKAASAPEVRDITEGSGFSLDIAAITNQICSVWRVCRAKAKVLQEGWDVPNSPVQLTRKLFSELGWTCSESWKWRHLDLDFTIDFRVPMRVSWLAHMLRATWRRKKWQGFLKRDRRDAREMQEVTYEEKRIQMLKRLIKDDGVLRLVACGGVRSPAFFAVAAPGKFAESCVWAGCTHKPACMDHICWTCPHRGNGPEPPTDVAQRRFGWPKGEDKEYDKQVLRHLGVVTCLVWSARYVRSSPDGNRYREEQIGVATPEYLMEIDTEEMREWLERVNREDKEMERWLDANFCVVEDQSSDEESEDGSLEPVV